MYRVMAGIEIDEAAPGYKHVLVQPRPGGGFTRVRASHDSMYGRVASAWEMRDGRFALDVEVPPNTRATVRLPNAQLAAVTEGGKPLAEGDGITGARQDGEAVVVEIGSGHYRFAYPMGSLAERR
jgi:alpha-L-rhamnosidase